MPFSAPVTSKAPSPLADTISINRKGVSIMPNTLEAAALHTAAGTLPRAMAVNAMDDDTADGNTPRYRNPSASSGGIHCGASNDTGNTASGKTRKVSEEINRCSRQCIAPASTCFRDSAAPCTKNSTATASVDSCESPSAKPPPAGHTVAATITVNNSSVKPSSRRSRPIIRTPATPPAQAPAWPEPGALRHLHRPAPWQPAGFHGPAG